MDRIKVDSIISQLDHFARFLADVQQGAIVNRGLDHFISTSATCSTSYFLGDAPNRNKVNLIIANEITPHLTAEEYMDKGEYENELKQVIGDTKAAYDISEHDTLVFGGVTACSWRVPTADTTNRCYALISSSSRSTSSCRTIFCVTQR